MRSAAMFLCGLLSLTGVLPVHAAEFGTREEAVAMVRRVQEKFKKDGPEATIEAVNARSPGFMDRDLFPYIHRIDGRLMVANAGIPSIVGKNLYDVQDQDGKFFVHEFVRTATTAPYHGWVDYRFFNPKTNTVEDKSAWIERIGDYYVGVGVYRNEQPNDKTVGIISGSPNSDDTYLQMAYDLAEVLNDGDNLRVLPIAGVGGTRNIRDVTSLRGVDVGLTQTTILNSFRRSNERVGQADDNRLVYIAKLFNEEVHLVARRGITSIEQLRGRKVNLDVKGSGTNYSMRDLLQAYGIDVDEVSMSQVEALDKVRSGEIAATAVIAGKPVRSLSYVGHGDGLHFVPLPYPARLIDDYLPATLDHDDYPELVAAGESVETVAVGAVLIAMNVPRTNERYARVQRFVDTLFSKIAEFQKPPHHPKWREVNLAATLPNWTRLPAAQEWLDNNRHRDEIADAAAPPPTPAARAVAPPAAARPSAESLLQNFMKWQQSVGGH